MSVSPPRSNETPSRSSQNLTRSTTPLIIRSRHTSTAPTPELTSNISTAKTSAMPSALITPVEIIPIEPRIVTFNDTRSPHNGITIITPQGDIPQDIPDDMGVTLATQLIDVRRTENTRNHIPNVPATTPANPHMPRINNEATVALVLENITAYIPQN